MSDLISRQAAIDEIKALYEWHDTVTEDRTIDHLKRLPSAQPELPIKKKCTICPHCGNCDVNDDGTIAQPEQRWIPVTESLPEDGQLVIFSTKTGRVHQGKYYGDNSVNQWYSAFDKMRAWNNVVNAWMPLPEPYKDDPCNGCGYLGESCVGEGCGKLTERKEGEA